MTDIRKVTVSQIGVTWREYEQITVKIMHLEKRVKNSVLYLRLFFFFFSKSLILPVTLGMLSYRWMGFYAHNRTSMLFHHPLLPSSLCKIVCCITFSVHLCIAAQHTLKYMQAGSDYQIPIGQQQYVTLDPILSNQD